MTLLSSWSEEQRVLSVPSLWQELAWSLPLVRSQANFTDHVTNSVILLELVASNVHVLGDGVGVRYASRASKPQDFIYDARKIIKFLTGLKVQDLID